MYCIYFLTELKSSDLSLNCRSIVAQLSLFIISLQNIRDHGQKEISMNLRRMQFETASFFAFFKKSIKSLVKCRHSVMTGFGKVYFYFNFL